MYDYYLNMEIAALEIVQEQINTLTDSNVSSIDDIYIDYKIFEDSLKKGFIIVTMLVAFVESSVNTILRDCIGNKNEKLLRCSTDEKLEIIYLFYKKDISQLKSSHLWGKYAEINLIRNELVHYKYNNKLIYRGADQYKIKNMYLSDIFTKGVLTDYSNQIKDFISKISIDLGLYLNFDCQIVDNNGRTDSYFFINKKPVHNLFDCH